MSKVKARKLNKISLKLQRVINALDKAGYVGDVRLLEAIQERLEEDIMDEAHK